jgi:hypothetical protein
VHRIRAPLSFQLFSNRIASSHDDFIVLSFAEDSGIERALKISRCFNLALTEKFRSSLPLILRGEELAVRLFWRGFFRSFPVRGNRFYPAFGSEFAGWRSARTCDGRSFGHECRRVALYTMQSHILRAMKTSLARSRGTTLPRAGGTPAPQRRQTTGGSKMANRN